MIQNRRLVFAFDCFQLFVYSYFNGLMSSVLTNINLSFSFNQGIQKQIRLHIYLMSHLPFYITVIKHWNAEKCHSRHRTPHCTVFLTPTGQGPFQAPAWHPFLVQQHPAEIHPDKNGSTTWRQAPKIIIKTLDPKR